MFIQLSEKAKETCKKHYGSYKKCGCGTCPIVRVCHAGPTGTRLTVDSHNRHTQQINEAAEAV